MISNKSEKNSILFPKITIFSLQSHFDMKIILDGLVQLFGLRNWIYGHEVKHILNLLHEVQSHLFFEKLAAAANWMYWKIKFRITSRMQFSISYPPCRLLDQKPISSTYSTRKGAAIIGKLHQKQLQQKTSKTTSISKKTKEHLSLT